MRAFWFNPENDIALAMNCVAFTPDVAAAQIHYSGALLPFWLTESQDDFVIVPNGTGEQARHFRELFGFKANYLELPKTPKLILESGTNCIPWGWSRASHHQFKRWGVDAANLPTNAQIALLRDLSSRKHTVEFLKHFDSQSTSPICASSIDEACNAIAKFDGKAFIKQPYSSSGRGVFDVEAFNKAQLHQIMNSALKRQGVLMIERKLKCLQNFAALFKASDEALEFKGISVFFNNFDTNYGGNIVAPQHYLYHYLTKYVNIEKLNATLELTSTVVNKLFASIIGFYNGWVGVDMMIHDNNGEAEIAPCIEINLRTTMGVVALKIAESRIFDDCSPATFRILDSHTSNISGADVSPMGGAARFKFTVAKQTF